MDKLHYYLGTGLKIREEWKPSFTNQPNTFSEEELTAKNIDSVGKKRYRLISSKPLMRPLSSLTPEVIEEMKSDLMRDWCSAYDVWLEHVEIDRDVN